MYLCLVTDMYLRTCIFVGIYSYLGTATAEDASACIGARNDARRLPVSTVSCKNLTL